MQQGSARHAPSILGANGRPKVQHADAAQGPRACHMNIAATNITVGEAKAVKILECLCHLCQDAGLALRLHLITVNEKRESLALSEIHYYVWLRKHLQPGPCCFPIKIWGLIILPLQVKVSCVEAWESSVVLKVSIEQQC